MNIKAYAKINLCLDVLKKSKKYHYLRTVFQQIGLHDIITIRETPSADITIKCDNPLVPLDDRNTVFKAAETMKKLAGYDKGLLISVKKNIPVASGLGGASSDAAAVMNALNKIWRLKLTLARLRALAAKVGMDTPFFIEGGTALGIHFGEKIISLPRLDLPPLLIVVPTRKKSTADMYRLLDLGKIGKQKNLTDYFVKNINNVSRGHFNLTASRDYLHNDFETLLSSGKMTRTKQIMTKLLRLGAKVVHICGSGPAIYSFYDNKAVLDQTYKNLIGQAQFLWKS